MKPLTVAHFEAGWTQDRHHGLQHSHPEAALHVIDTHHPDHARRIITAYANERRAFVRCAHTGELHDHIDLTHPEAHAQLARYSPTIPHPHYRAARRLA